MAVAGTVSIYLVDEFQDIDAQQFQTLQLLADRYRNLFIVGDDDQSNLRIPRSLSGLYAGI